MYSLYLALRYMAKRITSYLAIGSFMIGVAVLIIVTSIMTGFAEEMKEKIRGTASHMVVKKPGFNKTIRNYEEIMDRIGDLDHVEATSPRIRWFMLWNRRGLDYTRQGRSFLVGIDPEQERRTTNLEDYVVGGDVKFKYRRTEGDRVEWVEPEQPGILIGSTQLGMESPLYFPPQFENPYRLNVITGRLRSEEPIKKDFDVVGTFASGRYDYDQLQAYTHIDHAAELLDMEGEITEIAIALDEYRDDAVLNSVKEEIAQILSEYRGFSGRNSVETWKEQREELLNAVEMERSLTTILLFFIVVVAAFMLLAVLSMMVMEKRKDIGIIRSIGGTVTGVAGIFLCQGLIIGLIGATMGLVTGYLVTVNVNSIANALESVTGYHPFPDDVYILDAIPYVWNLETALFIAIMTVAISLLFSVIPAIRAARLEPIEAIRHE